MTFFFFRPANATEGKAEKPSSKQTFLQTCSARDETVPPLPKTSLSLCCASVSHPYQSVPAWLPPAKTSRETSETSTERKGILALLSFLISCLT